MYTVQGCTVIAAEMRICHKMPQSGAAMVVAKRTCMAIVTHICTPQEWRVSKAVSAKLGPTLPCRGLFQRELSLGHTPSTAGIFRRNSGKTLETLSEFFLEFPSRVRLGSPKPYHSRHLKAPEHFQNSLPPPVRLGTLLSRKKSVYTTTVETLLFFFFRLRPRGVYPSFRTYGVYPFPLFSQENGIHHSCFCSVTSGSGDRPRKEGCHGGVYSFFPCLFSEMVPEKASQSRSWNSQQYWGVVLILGESLKG